MSYLTTLMIVVGGIAITMTAAVLIAHKIRQLRGG